MHRSPPALLVTEPLLQILQNSSFHRAFSSILCFLNARRWKSEAALPTHRRRPQAPYRMRYRSFPRLPRGSTSPDFHALMYGYASLQQTAQTTADGGFHGFSATYAMVSPVSTRSPISRHGSNKPSAGARRTRFCRVAADHTGNARIRQRRTRIQHPSECMPAHGLNSPRDSLRLP